jgi:Phosphoribosyl-dephospho-CoA transferase (holo-ACP synthetase)
LKEFVLQIEYGHPIGRLFDFDVIGCDGNAVSREMLKYSKRKCLICGKDAYVCARSRAHNVEDLLKKIDYIVDTYIQQKTTAMFQ